jgi:hypothetical protein
MRGSCRWGAHDANIAVEICPDVTMIPIEHSWLGQSGKSYPQTVGLFFYGSVPTR